MKGLKILLLIFCIFLVKTGVDAQNIRDPVSALYPGFGAYSSKHADIFSGRANQAGLARLRSFQAGIYGERRFMMNALGFFTLIASIPIRPGNLALQVDYFGYHNYNESQGGLAYARSLGPKMDIGIKFNYYALRIPAYGSASSFNFELGSLLHISDKLHTGIHAYNPLGSHLGRSGQERLASIYRTGLGYEPSVHLLLSAEILKVEGRDHSINIGIHYLFSEKLQVRCGISTGLGAFFFGLGFRNRKIRLDLSVSFHQYLGPSPGLMILFPSDQSFTR
jgi:hypothetical protein